jgi:pyruvate formate lyase activating enzyme
LLDYPGRVSAVLFLPGCNLRCPWCQNRELVLTPGAVPQGIPLEAALGFIAGRRKVLGGVAVSGGEPTLYPQLGDIIGRIHGLGLPVKLDTNGMNPPALKALEGYARPDHIALDLKLAPERYGELLPPGRGPGKDPAKDPAGALAESAALIRSSGIPHEYRSLALPGAYFGPPDVAALSPLVDGGPWYFRPFAPGNCLEPAWDRFEAPADAESLAAEARKQGKNGIAAGKR